MATNRPTDSTDSTAQDTRDTRDVRVVRDAHGAFGVDGHPKRWSILAVLVVSLLVVVLDNTILNIALPTIQRELGASQSHWCGR